MIENVSFEILLYMLEMETDVEHDNRQDEQPHQKRLFKMLILLWTDITDHSPLGHSFVCDKLQCSVNTVSSHSNVSEGKLCC